MIRKSGSRFSEKMLLQQKLERQSIQSETIDALDNDSAKRKSVEASRSAPTRGARLAALNKRSLRNEPAREPAHGPWNRNEKDGGDGHHQRAPQITPAAGGENKLARRALHVSAHPA